MIFSIIIIIIIIMLHYQQDYFTWEDSPLIGGQAQFTVHSLSVERGQGFTTKRLTTKSAIFGKKKVTIIKFCIFLRYFLYLASIAKLGILKISHWYVDVVDVDCDRH